MLPRIGHWFIFFVFWGEGDYELAGFKRAEGGGDVFVGLTFLMSLFLSYFVSFTKDNDEKEKKKQGELNVSDQFQTIMKNVFLFVYSRVGGWVEGRL